MSLVWAAGRTALPEMRPARRKSTGRNALPPKMSLMARFSSPCRTACSPVEISGSEVARASTVAPKRTPGESDLRCGRGAALFCGVAGDEGEERSDGEDHHCSAGARVRFLRVAAAPVAVTGRVWAGVGGGAVLMPGQLLPRSPNEQEPGDPEHDDQQRLRGHPEQVGLLRELCAGDDDGEDGCDHDGLDDEDQGCGPVRDGRCALRAFPEDVQDDDDDGLQGDAAEDVADRDLDLTARCSGDRDRDLGQVGGDGEHDQPAESVPEVQLVVQDVRGLGELDTREPDHHTRRDEDRKQDRQRQMCHHARRSTRQTPHITEALRPA